MPASLNLLLLSGNPVPGAAEYLITAFKSHCMAPNGQAAVIVQARRAEEDHLDFLLTGVADGLVIRARTGDTFDFGAGNCELRTMTKVLPCGPEDWAVECQLRLADEGDPVQAILLKHPGNNWSGVWLQGERIAGGLDEIFRQSCEEWRSHAAAGTVVVRETIRGDLVTAENNQAVESRVSGTWVYHARKGVSIGRPETKPDEFARVRPLPDGGAFEARIRGFSAVAGGSAARHSGEAVAFGVPGEEPPGFPGLECAKSRLLATDCSGASAHGVFEVTLSRHGQSGNDVHLSRWFYLGELMPGGHLRCIFREGEGIPQADRMDWWMRSFDAAVLRGTGGVLQVSFDIGRQALTTKPRAILRWNSEGFHGDFIAPGLEAPESAAGTFIHDVALIAAGPSAETGQGRVVATTSIAVAAWIPGGAMPNGAVTAWVMSNGNALSLIARQGSEVPGGFTISHLRGTEGDSPASEDCLSDAGLLLLEVTLKQGEAADQSALITAALPA